MPLNDTAPEAGLYVALAPTGNPPKLTLVNPGGKPSV